MASPQIQPTSWWPSSTLPPPRSTTTTVAASASIQPPANMDAIIAIFQRLERRLDEQLAAASWPPRPNPDPSYGMPWDCQPSSSWDLPPARPVSSWDLPQSRLPYDQHAQRFPSSSSPDPDAYDPNLCSNPSYWNYSDPYAYDPPVGRPLTSWDLPRPRIESYGGGGSSPYMYGASRTHGDGGYAPSSYHGGGYSGGGYANESNSYAPPPPPPQVSCYVPAPQPNPPSRPQPQQPDGGYVLVPPSYTPPPHPWDSPCSLTTLNDVRFTTSIEKEKERGVREMVEEEKKDTEVTENPIIEAETLSKTIVHRVEKDKRSQLSTDSEISAPRASFLASSKAFVAIANPGRCFSTVVKVPAAAQNKLDRALDIKVKVEGFLMVLATMETEICGSAYEDARRQRRLENKKRFEDLGIVKISKSLTDLTRSEKPKVNRQVRLKPMSSYSVSVEPRRSSRARNQVTTYRDDVDIEHFAPKRSRFNPSSWASYLARPAEEVKVASYMERGRAFNNAEKEADPFGFIPKKKG